MKLTEKQQKYLLSKYKDYSWGHEIEVLMIEQMPEYKKNEYDVYRKDLQDHTSLHLLTDEEISLLLSLSSDPEINQTVYSEEKIKRAERIRRYGY